MRIYTSRYGNKELAKREDLAKVGITVGTPRFKLAYPVSYVRMLAPAGLREIHDRAEFEPRYFAQLDALGVDAIRGRLAEVAGGRDVVLLCFEDLAQPGKWCHRRVFADYWFEKTGEAIAELDTATKPQPALL